VTNLLMYGVFYIKVNVTTIGYSTPSSVPGHDRQVIDEHKDKHMDQCSHVGRQRKMY